MTRLLVVSSYFDTHRGGLEIVAGELARRLAERFSVSWLASDAVAPDALREVDLLPVRAWNITERRFGIPFPLPVPTALVRLFKAVKSADAVMLHDALYPLSIATAAAAKLCGKPLLVLQHIGAVPYRDPLPRLMMAIANRVVARPILAMAEQVVFISYVVRDYFADVGFEAPPQVIFNGVDTKVFHPGDRTAARDRFDLEAEAKIALFVGRFVEKKGLHVLEAAARARPDLNFAFAGWGPVDPAAWGLPNVKVFPGLSGRRLADLYRAANVLVLPSQGEGFPLVVQEALACDLPVVCGAETVRADPAAAGCLVGVEVAGDPSEAAAGVVAAIDEVLAAADEPAPQRQVLVRERYGWSAAADRYAGLLERVIRERDAVNRGANRAALGRAS